LAGAPIIIKDNILYEGHRASAGSKMLENFVAPYSATIVEKMISEDAVILGRANMDEFAMGTTGENSAFGATLNALDDTCVAGGSSSGSAVAVAAGLCLGAIGTDTGGSVRVPAVNNGVAGIKPTYGTVSRYGIVAYASGLEQAGAICKTAADVELLQNAISGQDGQDATLLPEVAFDAKFDISKLKVGFIGEVRKYKDKIQGFEKYEALLEWYRASGATVKDVSMPLLDLCLPVYYIIAAAEMTSNLARFDGVKYTTAAKDAETIGDLYVKTRTRYFGKEVKRRIMLGNFVLSSGYFDAYYGKAKKVQNAVRESFKKAFEGVDCIIMPVSNSDAVKLGEKINDPVEMYLIDIFTVTANVAGVPSLALPFDTGKKGLPIGYQLIGPHHSEPFLYSVAKFFEKGVRK
jgi:aspartyl-tRNA(Asn)/glutamyl-tRNA(Gln) amidotransferase subunit A